MPHFARNSSGATFVSLLGGASAIVLVSYLALSSVSTRDPSPSRADASVVAARPAFQALREPLAAASPAGQMSAAVPTGQYEELVRLTAVPTAVPSPTVAPAPAPPTPAPQPALPVFESGLASTYGEGDGFEGNLTACGQVFHTLVVQVAHKSLPCGTLLRIEDATTGRSVVAEVTDRGPYIPGRIVDLSWGAFEQLDPSGPGLLNVKLYLMDQ